MKYMLEKGWLPVVIATMVMCFTGCSTEPDAKQGPGDACQTENVKHCDGTERYICSLGYWVLVEDCAQRGLVCIDGMCEEFVPADGDDIESMDDIGDDADPVDDMDNAEPDIDEAIADTDPDSIDPDLADGDLDDGVVESDPDPDPEPEPEIDPDPEPEPDPDPEIDSDPPPACTTDAQCNDNNVCTDDKCIGGQCTRTNTLGGNCDDGDACTIGDFCLNGACKPGVARNCDDGKACTVDSCSGGQCRNTLAGGYCLINDACVAQGAPDPDNQCWSCQPAVRTNWYSIDTGRSCSDGVSCTDDACNANGDCEGTVKSNYCLINGTCYVTGSGMPGVSCGSCDASRDQEDWSVDSGYCLIGNTCYTSGTHKATTGDDFCLMCNADIYQTQWHMLNTNMPCDDGLACTTLDHCDGAGGCTHTYVTAGWCVVNAQCTQQCP